MESWLVVGGYVLLIGVPIAFWIFIARIIVRGYRRNKEIAESTQWLGEGPLTEEKVRDYIAVIRKGKFPNTPHNWNTCRAGYALVDGDPGVSSALKQELKRTMQSMGVSGIR